MGVTEANDALLESWELDLRSPIRPGTRPKRQSTIEHYLQEANRFALWLAEHGRPAAAPGDLALVERADGAAWIAAMRTEGRSPATVRNRWIAMRSFYGWAHDEEVLPTNPFAKINVPKADEPPPDVLTDDQINALLNECRGTTFKDRRDFAMFRFMIATGLRVSEHCAIEAADLDLRTRIAAVSDGKGGKSRLTRFDPATAAALDRYKRIRGRHRRASRPEFWLGNRGPVTRKGFYTILHQRAEAAGIGHVHPHQLRHTFAHRAKNAGASEEDLMRLAGWADSKSLARYGSQLSTERALAHYDDFDPLGGL